MKKKFFVTISIAVVMLMIVTAYAVNPPAASASDYYCTMTLEELEVMFAAGRYWNHVGLSSWDITTTTAYPCTSTHQHGKCGNSGSCGCNSYKGLCAQCMGFAYSLQYLAFNGFDGYPVAKENHNYSDAMSKLKAGDVIRYYNNGVLHSIFVTKVEGDTITFMDCNGTGSGCIIRHGETITKTGLKKNFVYVTHAPCELVSNAAKRVNLYETAVVTSKIALRVRQYPSINAASIGTLNPGAAVKVCHYPITDSSGNTWRRLLDGSGWVSSSYLQITGGRYLASGNYKIQCANGKYLSYASTPQNGRNIVSFDDLSGTSQANLQVWNFQPLAYFADSGAMVYRISPAANTKFSLDSDQKNNTILQLWEVQDSNAQKWIVEVRPDGSLQILNAGTRLALDVMDASNANNAEIITYTPHTESNQKFYLVAL
ncbi:MAG: RICIN domain-containing protein [Bacillota bacterium]|nr:RICIN domain-containing protein [Bacillota bacterium]